MDRTEPVRNIAFRERYRLGRRAFFLFLLRRIKLPLILLVLAVAVWRFDYLVPAGYGYLVPYLIEVGFIFFAAALAFRLFQTYLEYIGYSFVFEKEYFHITQGYFAKNEISVAYHQIQHVNIRTNYLAQTLGICHLTVVMAGNELEKSRMILPAISTDMGRLVQRELMHQARRHFYPSAQGSSTD